STEEVLRFDRKRTGKTVSNADWKSATDGDATIARMKDGTTHLAYKAEHVVDLDSDLVLAAEIRPATAADTATLADSLVAAQINLQAAGSDAVIEAAAGDKGYHAAATIEMCDFLEVRTYIPEPQLAKPATWPDQPEEQRRAALNNRRRMERPKGKALQRRRSEVVERTFAHICETGGSRRSHLRGLANVTKRYLIAAAAHNLGRILRRLTGIGKPKALQGGGGLAALGSGLAALFRMAGMILADRFRRWIDRVRRFENTSAVRFAV
ncbi:MAG: transposase, partial [Pirellulales bacterium]